MPRGQTERKWKRLQSRVPNVQYAICEDGTCIREYNCWVDKKGVIRGTSEAHLRKLWKKKRKYNMKKALDSRGFVLINMSLENDKYSKDYRLHKVMADLFLPPPPDEEHSYLVFIDGDKENVCVSNLRWGTKSEAVRSTMFHRDHLYGGKQRYFTKYYKVPDWHIVYSKYLTYLSNRQKAAQLILTFMREHNLFSGLVKTGISEKIVERKGEFKVQRTPFFMFTDKDAEIFERDLKTIGYTYSNVRADGFCQIRAASPLMKDWLKMCEKNDNFRVLEQPDITDYILMESSGKIEKQYSMVDRELYVRVTCTSEFEMKGDFIEIEENEGRKYFK